MCTGRPTAAAGTRTGAIRRLIRSADPSGATSKTLAKKTRSRPLTWDSRSVADGTPTETTARRKPGDVNDTDSPGGSNGCRLDRSGVDPGAVKFDVSE